MNGHKKVNVKIIVDEDLDPLTPFQQFVVDEFKHYKQLSLTENPNNFIAPNEGIQAKRPSIHNLYGRDRVFDYPTKWAARIVKENLTHVHFDSEEQWDKNEPQWECTSKEAVVYSGFLMPDGTYHFVIHDLLLATDEEDFDAHDYYQEEDLKYYLDNSEYHRKKIQK
ncbi:hypothetical protein [Grimontia sp. NTOU-MAR1]|uniref:hypothetical protein n=1 Tax=Grimontia sp. NTOU-MAR1 TaxID=3111011 RepID=UPI002DBD8581|nr:hypothetical protein [Grimontia sp. NTOU-MAR1]WRV96393.1 hypothetical protein VP504_09645 [Grimontia sp. NTOU-MAR1]